MVKTKRKKKEPIKFYGMPTCPRWLDGEERKVWEAITPLLEKMEKVSNADQSLISEFCVLYVKWRKAEKQIKKRGYDFYITQWYYKS